jgi:DNA-binding response OmpR family regulator
MKIYANRILIIDDNSDYRKLLTVFLSNIFENAKIVQHDLAAFPGLDISINWSDYDLLLLDYNLGQEKNGLDWYKDLKTIDNFPTTVMLTGEGNERLAVEAIKNGIDDYISKENLTKSKLAKVIHEASKTHQEKHQKRLSFTHQGRVFNKALFYSDLDSAINLQNINARLIIIKCNSHSQNNETIGIIYQDNQISFIAEKIYNFLLNMNLEIKIISMEDKYIALLITNDLHEITYLPEKICQHMEKITFTEGEISCEVFH